MWLRLTKRKRNYVADHGTTLLGFLPNHFVELRVKDGDLEVVQNDSLYPTTWSHVGSLEKYIPRKSWRSVRKEGTSMLGEAMSYLLKPLKRAAESGFEIPQRAKRPQSAFQ